MGVSPLLRPRFSRCCRRGNFTSADMRYADFSGSNFVGAYLEKAVAAGTNFEGTLLHCSTFSWLELRNQRGRIPPHGLFSHVVLR
jgi:uncharacterized protein YjbI with pentapeptide repeats